MEIHQVSVEVVYNSQPITFILGGKRQISNKQLTNTQIIKQIKYTIKQIKYTIKQIKYTIKQIKQTNKQIKYTNIKQTIKQINKQLKYTNKQNKQTKQTKYKIKQIQKQINKYFDLTETDRISKLPSIDGTLNPPDKFISTL